MIGKSNKQKILAVFFDYPLRQFQIRQISRMTKIAMPSVKAYLDELAKEGLVKKEQGQLFPCFIANRESKAFGILKLSALLLSLEETGLIQEIMKFYPDCIVLFGSASKGEDTEKSDIDLFVQAKAVNLKTDQFEKKLNRRVNLIFEENIPALQKELLNNLANGIVIRGYLKVI